MTTSAVVKAVSLSGTHGFSKQPQPAVRLLAGEGVEGDAHCGQTTQHLYLMRRNRTLPNLCQVHLFASEMLDEIATHGFAVTAGEVGENVLTQSIDLLALPRGTRLHLGDEAVVEVTGLRTPCSRIDDFQRGLQARLWGPRSAAGKAAGKKTRRAGIMSIVIKSGDVRPGDRILIELPPEPHIALGPV